MSRSELHKRTNLTRMKIKKYKAPPAQKGKETQICLVSLKVDKILQKRWMELAFLGVLFLVAFLIRLAILKYYRTPLEGDAAIYGKIAWGIKTGHGLHWWAVVWSPFYPFMTFLFSFFAGGLESAAFAVSIFLGSLTVVPFFYLAKRIFNHQVAYLGSFLVVFYPALITISVVPLSEATYTFFLLTAIWCGWLLLSERSYLYAGLFGILSGVCYLTRPEFLVAFVFILLVFLVTELRRKLAKKTSTWVLFLVSVAGFLILALPYINFMHSQTGHWILSGKTAHNILKQQAYSKEEDYLQQRRAFAEVLDGLTPDGEIKGKVLLGERSLLGYVTSPNFFGNYFALLLAGIKSINLFFTVFLVLSLFYLLSDRVDGEGWKKRIFLLCAFSPILTMPVFFVPTGRLVEPYAPILILLSLAGILNLRNVLFKSSSPAVSFKTLNIGSLAILLFVALLSVLSLVKEIQAAEDHENVFRKVKMQAEEFKKLGLWADQTLPKDAVVMFLSGDSFFFYCNRVTFPAPFVPVDQIIEFAKRNKIDYLVVSLGKEVSWREDLTFLLNPLRDSSKPPEDSRLKLEDIYQAPSGMGAVVYKFE